MESYSQSGQDIFVYSLIASNTGSFLDLGCRKPIHINNTYLLELKGWKGLSLDIDDYEDEWKIRSTPFLRQDCFNVDYEELLANNFNNSTIDYLSLDMELLGDRFKLLDIVLKTTFDFKIITIEHDSYIGSQYTLAEKIPQRELLTSKGYVLVCADVAQAQNPTLPFEDWWVNPKHIPEKTYKKWKSDGESVDKIFSKNGIAYTIHAGSTTW